MDKCHITFVRLGLKITCSEYGGNCTKFVACEVFQNFFIKYNVAEIDIIGCVELSLKSNGTSFKKIGHMVQKLHA